MACIIANLAVEQIHGVISRAESEIRHALASDAAAIAAKVAMLAAAVSDRLERLSNRNVASACQAAAKKMAAVAALMSLRASAVATETTATLDETVSESLVEFQYPQIKMVLDPGRGKKYYFNTSTSKSGWALQDVIDGVLPDDIETRYDANHGAHFYFNKTTQKSGWTREELVQKVLPKQATNAAAAPTLVRTASVDSAVPPVAPPIIPQSPSGNQPAQADEIEERWDATHKTKYFYNKATKKSGWTRAEVGGTDGSVVSVPAASAGPGVADDYDDMNLGALVTGSGGSGGNGSRRVLKKGAKRKTGAAQKCKAPGCASLHKYEDGFCHKHRSMAPPEGAAAAAGAGAANEVEEKWDPNHKAKFYVNKATGKSGWTREEVLSAPAGAASTVPAPVPKKTALGGLKTRMSGLTRRSSAGLRKKSVTASKCMELGCDQVHRYPDGYCHLHRKNAPVVGQADEIEERWDATHKTKYFYNKATKKSGWTRAEVERAEVERAEAAGGAGTGGGGGVAVGGAMQGVMNRTARAMSGGARKLMAYVSSGGGPAPGTGPGVGTDDNIEVKWDPKHGRNYFFNKVTLRSGWTRAEVEETTDWVHSTTDGPLAGDGVANQNPLMRNPMKAR
jgi:hypothetical protein